MINSFVYLVMIFLVFLLAILASVARSLVQSFFCNSSFGEGGILICMWLFILFIIECILQFIIFLVVYIAFLIRWLLGVNIYYLDSCSHSYQNYYEVYELHELYFKESNP